jgi:hypothetical protein
MNSIQEAPFQFPTQPISIAESPHGRMVMAMKGILENSLAIINETNEMEATCMSMIRSTPWECLPTVASDVLHSAMTLNIAANSMTALGVLTVKIAKEAIEAEIKEFSPDPVKPKPHEEEVLDSKESFDAKESDSKLETSSEIENVKYIEFIKNIPSFLEVEKGTYGVLKAHELGIVSFQVRRGLAVAAKGISRNGSLINIGLAFHDGLSKDVVAKMLKKIFANKNVSRVETFVIGGFEDTVAPEGFFGDIEKQITAFSKTTIKAKLLNPYQIDSSYKTDPSSKRIIKGIMLIGFSLNVGITKEGKIIVNQDSTATKFNLEHCRFVQLFIQNHPDQLARIIRLAKTIHKNSKEIVSKFNKSLEMISTRTFPKKTMKDLFMRNVTIFRVIMDKLQASHSAKG